MNLDSLDLSGQDDGAQPDFWQGPPAQLTAKSGTIKLLLCSFGWQGEFCWMRASPAAPELRKCCWAGWGCETPASLPCSMGTSSCVMGEVV